MRARSWLVGLGLILTAGTQTGCLTMLTATACVASESKSGCGETIGAAATADAVILDAASRASDVSERERDAYVHDHERRWNCAVDGR